MRHIFQALIALWTLTGVALAQTKAPPVPVEPGWHGLTFETVTSAFAAERKLPPFGALVTVVEPASPAAEAGLAAGDLILSFGGVPVVKADELAGHLAKLAAGAEAQLGRMRGGAVETVRLRLAEKPRPMAEPAVAGAAPRLMLDTGGHTALIRGLAWTPDGRQIVSAGDDKVIRVWDAATGKTVRTLRGEVGPGDEGKIFAMALSPDGRWLAVGGWMKVPGQGGHHIHLYDIATGALVTLLKGHGNVVLGLAFSPDGGRLISGSFDTTAILWQAGSAAEGGWQAGRLLHRLEGHTNFIFAVGFTPDGARAVTGSYDATLRLWDVTTGKPIGGALAGHTDKVQALAVNPTDGSIVSGSYDGEIRVWDGKTGRFLRTMGRQSSHVGFIAFSPEGKRLLSTCGGGPPCASEPQIVWNAAENARVIEPSHHDNVVLAAAISPDGRWAATGGGANNEIHIWDIATGERRRGPDRKPLTLGGTGAPGWAAGISSDGQRIAWGAEPMTLTNQFTTLRYELRLPSTGVPLGRPESIAALPKPGESTLAGAATFLRARPEVGAWSLQHRSGGTYGYEDAILDIRRDGATVASITRGTTDGLVHNAYTLTPDGNTIISGGGNGSLIAYDRTGKGLALFIGHEGDVWAVTPSADGRFLVTGSADQTFRLWPLAPLKDADVVPTDIDGTKLPPKTISPIVTLFHGRDGEWALWTEEGFYTGSPGAGAIVGWQLNNGPGRAADYVRATQVRDALLRPDIVDNAIRLGSSKAAIKAAGLDGVSIDRLLRRRPPVIRVEGADKDLAAFGGRVILTVVAGANPLPLDGLSAWVTSPLGVETKVEPRAVPLPAGVVPQRADGSRAYAYEVPLFKGINVVRFVARNAGGDSEEARAAVTHNGEGALDNRGKLWIVAVGVDKYPGAKAVYKDLEYAGKDAEALAATAAATMATTHTGTPSTVVLVNGRSKAAEPTRANILAALEQVARESADTDTVLLIFAGHGETWNGRYHFLPTDLARAAKGDKGRNVIDWKDDVQPLLARMKGRRIVVLDACYAGSSNQTLTAEAVATRFTAFQAATEGQLAWEFKEDGHGAFTAALIAGLKGDAGALDPQRRAVTVYRLGPFVKSVVEHRTKGAQTPEFQPSAGDMVLVRK